MINLNTQFAREIQSRFAAESVVANRLSQEYDFKGAKTVRVLTPITAPMNDYTPDGANRYGTPVEMQDMYQELTLTRDRGFAFTIDKSNLDDGMFLKNAGRMLGLQLRERAIPEMDRYILKKLANGGGSIVADGAMTAKNICAMISAAVTALDDAEVPNNDRTLFISSAGYACLKHSDEFMAVESIARDALRRGVVGRYDNMDVVKVPAARWPKHVNFMAVSKYSAVAPAKISDTQIHTNPPGISGALIEGRQYYDCFVYGVKCEGIYVSVNTSDGSGKITATPTISAGGAISCADAGAVIKYTTDGSDPRYSSTAKSGTQSDETAAGTVVRAYAYCDEEGVYPSSVAEMTL